MDNFKLKLLLTILSSIIFAFVFILLTFALPLDKVQIIKKPENKLEVISKSFRDRGDD